MPLCGNLVDGDLHVGEQHRDHHGDQAEGRVLGAQQGHAALHRHGGKWQAAEILHVHGLGHVLAGHGERAGLTTPARLHLHMGHHAVEQRWALPFMVRISSTRSGGVAMPVLSPAASRKMVLSRARGDRERELKARGAARRRTSIAL